MKPEKKECKDDVEPDKDTSHIISKVSAVIFDEKTGTITLKLASEEEIAQDIEK